jgi:hypothetical protein
MIVDAAGKIPPRVCFEEVARIEKKSMLRGLPCRSRGAIMAIETPISVKRLFIFGDGQDLFLFPLSFWRRSNPHVTGSVTADATIDVCF